MPASERQLAHLQQLNALERTQQGRFQKGQSAWNKSDNPYPRDARRRLQTPCIDCGKLKQRHYPRCKRCGYVARRKTHIRKGMGGYMFATGRVQRGNGIKGTRPKPIHIEMAEQVLGRPMKQGEHVHHINLDRADNRRSNLLICSASYHMWLHARYAKRFVELHLKP